MTPRKHRPPTPLSPAKQAYVRHYYPLGYGTFPLAKALSVNIERIRYLLRTEGFFRHSTGGNQRIYSALPPLPPFGTPVAIPPPTGDLDVWNRVRLPGWAIHGEMRARTS